MLRFALFAASMVLLAPATASAAPFGELPFLATGAAATCLRATGAPGELIRSSRNGARFLHAGPTGIAETGLVETGTPQEECPQVAARPSGAAVIAQSGSGLWVATRDPGGGWTKPARLAPEASRAAVAVADSGAAVVAWLEPGSGKRFTVKAMRRPAGGAFGAAETLGDASSSTEYLIEGTVRAAIAADGEALVLWTQPPADRKTRLMPVNVSIAPPGAAFAAARRVGLTVATSSPALAAGPDGRALAVLVGGRDVQLAERPPGGAFGAPVAVASVTEPFAVLPAVAVGSGGAAVVGWYGLFSQGVSAVARTQTGPFGKPVTLSAPAGAPGLGQEVLTLLSVFGVGGLGPTGADGPGDADAGNLRAALTPDGRAVLTWNTLLGTPRVATLPLAGGHVDRFPAGPGTRLTGSVTPLITAAGAPAIAWTDNAASVDPDGRVHVAVEGFAAAADAPAPRVTLGRPRDTTLEPDQALRLPVTCSSACEVRVDLPDQFESQTYVQLAGAGTRVVSLRGVFTPIAPDRRGPVRVRLRFSAPGAHAGTERIETVTLARSRAGHVPVVEGLKAVRHGSRVDVSWRTDRKTEPDSFAVVGLPGRSLEPEGAVTTEHVKSAGGRRFTARLTGAKEIRYVFVFSASQGEISRPYVTKVR
jgi:hypothetical protein